MDAWMNSSCSIPACMLASIIEEPTKSTKEYKAKATSTGRAKTLPPYMVRALAVEKHFPKTDTEVAVEKHFPKTDTEVAVEKHFPKTDTEVAVEKHFPKTGGSRWRPLCSGRVRMLLQKHTSFRRVPKFL